MARKEAQKSVRAYVAWSPTSGFAMWTLSGIAGEVKRKVNLESDGWRAWIAAGFVVRRVRVSIY
jgi:hypothetical protein